MNTKRKFFIISASFAISVIALGVFILWPVANGIVDSAGELREKRIEVLRIEEEQEYAVRFQQFQETHQADLRQIEDLFVDSETPSAFGEYLEEVARRAGVEFEVNPSEPMESKEDRWPSMLIRINSEGTYEDIEEVLLNLENAPYLIEISGVNIQRQVGPEGIPSGPIGFDITLKVYVK